MWEVRPPQKPPSKRPNAIQLGIAIALALLALGDDVGRAVFVTARSELAPRIGGGRAVLMWFAVACLACLAVMIVLAARAPIIDIDPDLEERAERIAEREAWLKSRKRGAPEVKHE